MILKLILRFVLLSKHFQTTILDHIHVRTYWINRQERLTAIVLNESIWLRDDLHDRDWILWVMAFPLCMVGSWCSSGNRAVSHKGPNKLCSQVILCSTIYHRSASDVVDYRKRMFTRPHSRMYTSVVIPFWLGFKLSLGCETWTAVLAALNQCWVTMYGYWSSPINANISLQEEDNCKSSYPHPLVICLHNLQDKAPLNAKTCMNTVFN